MLQLSTLPIRRAAFGLASCLAVAGFGLWTEWAEAVDDVVVLPVVEQSTLWPPDANAFRDVFFVVENTTTQVVTDCAVTYDIRDGNGAAIQRRTSFGDYLVRVGPGDVQYLAATTTADEAVSVVPVAAACKTSTVPANSNLRVLPDGSFRPDQFNPRFQWLTGTVTNINGSTAEGVHVVVVCGARSNLSVWDTTFPVDLAAGETRNFSVLRTVEQAECNGPVRVFGTASSPPTTPPPMTASTTTTTVLVPPSTSPSVAAINEPANGQMQQARRLRG